MWAEMPEGALRPLRAGSSARISFQSVVIQQVTLPQGAPKLRQLKRRTADLASFDKLLLRDKEWKGEARSSNPR